MSDTVEVQEGIFEFSHPQMIRKETWINEHLDCDSIIDDQGSSIVVYAFTQDPKYNYDLEEYKRNGNFSKQYILRGISSDGLSSLFSFAEG